MEQRTNVAVPKEDAEQVIIFEWANWNMNKHPELALLYAIPNGGKRSIKTARMLKATGVKAGVPDMCLPVPRYPYHGLYIELKRRKGGRVSEKQSEWLQVLMKEGYKTCVCYGSDEAIQVIEDYLKGEQWTFFNAL